MSLPTRTGRSEPASSKRRTLAGYTQFSHISAEVITSRSERMGLLNGTSMHSAKSKRRNGDTGDLLFFCRKSAAQTPDIKYIEFRIASSYKRKRTGAIRLYGSAWRNYWYYYYGCRGYIDLEK